MQRIDIKNWLVENKMTIIFIVVAYIFAIAVRLIWVYQFQDTESFKHNDQFMINTNDGYYWAKGARDLLAGTSQANDLSPVFSSVSILTAFLVSKLPFEFETIIFYLPAFLSALLVIPIILIGQSLGNLKMGFIAALIGSIAWSYYNRTMVGYYDTDMLNIVLPTILVWSLIAAFQTKSPKYQLIAALDMIVYRWWYPQSYSLEFAFILLIGAYTFYQHFIKKEENIYTLQLVTLLLFAMMNLDGFYRFLMVLFIYFLFHKTTYAKYLYHILAVAVVMFYFSGGLDPIISQLKGYVFRSSTDTYSGELSLHFFSVMQTVREAGEISFETFANRISGHIITFILSIIGYGWLVYKHKVMLLGLPMIGLGFLAYGIPGLISGGGLRFTIYAVPMLAFGIAFLIVQLSLYLKKDFLKNLFITLCTIAILFPNIVHIINYKVPTVFNSDEVALLTKLHDIASREDYVVAWWDYGYPIRYYSDVKTLIDGGKHSGSQNYPVSYALTSPQVQAANMMRLSVEFTQIGFKQRCGNNIIECIMSGYNLKDPDILLAGLKNIDLDKPNPTRDIYLYLPLRMMDIFPTVHAFSNIDLKTGKSKQSPFFYRTKSIKEDQNQINLGSGIKVLKNEGMVQVGEIKVPIHNFIITKYDNNGKLHKNVQVVNEEGGLNLVFMQSYSQALVLDNEMFNSTYIQLFVLEELNKELFEPTLLSPFAKVYKLKI